MLTRYRWPLLILAFLFVLWGAYAVRQKTGGNGPDPTTRVITPIAPPRMNPRGAN